MIISRHDMTPELVREFLEYDASTGFLTWKTKHHSRKVVVGARAGSVSPYGHRVLRLCGVLYPEHRIIWLHYYGKWPIGHVDHINHDEQDNRIENLREVSQQENNMNNSKRKDNSTGHAGVWINKLNTKKRFMAELTLHGKRVHYSSHYTLEDAVAARKQAEKVNGFHPNHGIEKP